MSNQYGSKKNFGQDFVPVAGHEREMNLICVILEVDRFDARRDVLV